MKYSETFGKQVPLCVQFNLEVEVSANRGTTNKLLSADSL